MIKTKKVISLYILILLSLQSFSQRNLIVVDDMDYPNEPTIALHPSNPKLIVAASNIDNFYYSVDNGSTWSKTKATSKYGIYGDPVLHYAGETLFFAHLSKTPGKKYGDWFDRIVVQKIDSVKSWTETSYSVGYNNAKMQDKPWLSSDDHSPSYKGQVYVTWTEFDKYGSDDPNDFSRIRFSKFIPNVDSFTTAITISDSTGDCRDGDNTLEGVTTAVGKNGEIYTVWAGHDKIWFDYSMDGGDSWNVDKAIASQQKGWDMKMPNINRANGMPFVKCDKERGTLYVVWADEDKYSSNVYLKYSSDMGKSWSKRICMNNNNRLNHHYFPSMAIDEQSGLVYVSYFDQQHSDKHLFYDISLSVFDITQLPLLGKYRITTKSIPLPGENIFFGDYIDMDIVGDTIAIIYPTYYDNTVAIEMYYGDIHPWKSGNLEDTDINPYSLSFLEQKDSIVLYINVQSPGKLKGKFKYGKRWEKTKIKLDFLWDEVDIDKDYILFTYPKDVPYRIKYKIRNLGNNSRYSRAISSK